MKNIYQSKGLEEKDHDLSGQFLTTILSVFPNTVDFSRMNVYNWHHEQKEYQNWSEVNDSPNIGKIFIKYMKFWNHLFWEMNANILK